MLDREFSYLELLENLAFEAVNYVIRLKVGVNLYDEAGKIVDPEYRQGRNPHSQQAFLQGQGLGECHRGVAKRLCYSHVDHDEPES